MKLNRLSDVKKDTKCIVRNFEGGQGMINKLNALGIGQGREIVKTNDSFIGGPITVQVVSTKIAIGKNMASKIIVEVME